MPITARAAAVHPARPVHAAALGQVVEARPERDDPVAADQVVCPGLIDLAARLREPGFEYKATIASETLAASRSGITTLCCPPDTDPVIDTPAVVTLTALWRMG